MKLKELALDINLKNIKIELTDEVFEKAKKGGLNTKIVYIQGPFIGEFFVKKQLKETRIYPLLLEDKLWELLKECEVLDKRYKRKRNQTKL